MGTAAILFAIAAVGGAVMAAIRLGGADRPPLAIAIVHGLFAAAGLVTLIVAVTSQAVPVLAKVAVAGFIVAALGGFTLLGLYHLQKRPLPIPLMLVHATVAVISFILLLVGIFAT